MKQRAKDGLLRFIEQSPTTWHACASCSKELDKAGFSSLQESERWDLKAEGQYYLLRDGSSLCAFRLPKGTIKRCLILAAHTDSPSFTLKPNFEVIRNGTVLWGVSPYGSPLLQSWWNRECYLAGKVFYLDQEGKPQEALLDLRDTPVLMPQLAIHLEKEAVSKGVPFQKEGDCYVLAGSDLGSENHLVDLLKERLPIQQLLGHHLMLVPMQSPAFWGLNREGVSSYRLDNLASCHAIMEAFTDSSNVAEDCLSVIYFSDHEEVGSESYQGAASPMLEETLQRIFFKLAPDASIEDFYCMKSRSACFSLDVAHGYHPAQGNRSEPSHLLQLGKGVALKSSSQQRYTQHSALRTHLQSLALNHQLPLQEFIMRNDIPSGSTIGPILSSRVGIRTMDLGHPLLSMHSAREAISLHDHEVMITLLQKLLENPMIP